MKANGLHNASCHSSRSVPCRGKVPLCPVIIAALCNPVVASGGAISASDIWPKHNSLVTTASSLILHQPWHLVSRVWTSTKAGARKSHHANQPSHQHCNRLQSPFFTSITEGSSKRRAKLAPAAPLNVQEWALLSSKQRSQCS